MAADYESDPKQHQPAPAGDASRAAAHAELTKLLSTVLTAMPYDDLDRLLESRIRFLAGDDTVRRRSRIDLEFTGRYLARAAPPARLIYLNSTQLLARTREESLYLVARTVAQALLWRDGKSGQSGGSDLEQLADQAALAWGFERPRQTLLTKLRNAIGLG
jgi:hypothetical protein